MYTNSYKLLVFKCLETLPTEIKESIWKMSQEPAVSWPSPARMEARPNPSTKWRKRKIASLLNRKKNKILGV